MCVTEHSCDTSKFGEMKTEFGKNIKVHMSNLDNDKTHNVGGTGLLLKGDRHIIMPESQCPDFQNIRNQGRVGLYALQINQDLFVLVYVCYGYTGGAVDKNHQMKPMKYCNV